MEGSSSEAYTGQGSRIETGERATGMERLSEMEEFVPHNPPRWKC